MDLDDNQEVLQEVLILPQQLQHDLAYWIEGNDNRERRHSRIGTLRPTDYDQSGLSMPPTQPCDHLIGVYEIGNNPVGRPHGWRQASVTGREPQSMAGDQCQVGSEHSVRVVQEIAAINICSNGFCLEYF